MLVYVITNKINGKRYVGQTVKTLEQRWAEHKSKALAGENLLFYNAIRKYGLDAFWLGVVAEAATREELSQLECLWIERLETFGPKGYNMTAGGEGAVDYRHTPESLAIMSAKKLGIKRPADVCRRIGDARRGKKMSAFNRAQLLAAVTGRKKSTEECFKVGKAMRGKTHTEETRRKMRDARLRYFEEHPEAKQVSEATRSAALKVQLGSKATEETRQKMKVAQSARRNKEKQQTVSAFA